MNFIDFLIGFFLMNAMPHYVLGIWNQKILGAFGFGDKSNIAYGLLCFGISISLFIYQYGLAGILENGIYAGAMTILIIYFFTSSFLKKVFTKKP